MERAQEEMAAHIRNLENNYQNVLNEMVNFQRNMAQQDGLMQNLIQYFLQPENGEQVSSQNLTFTKLILCLFSFFGRNPCRKSKSIRSLTTRGCKRFFGYPWSPADIGWWILLMARRYRMIINVICCISLLDYALGTIATTIHDARIDFFGCNKKCEFATMPKDRPQTCHPFLKLSLERRT